MLSASETDRTTVEARLRAEVEQLLEDNLQLKRHKLEEASTCDGVVKLIKRYDRDRHATLDELNAGLAGIISRRTKLRRESRIRDAWEAEVVALQAQVHADGPRYKRLRNIKQKIAADLERDKQQVKLRQAPVDETTAPRPPHSVSVTPLELKFWENGKVDAKDTSLADLKALELGDHPKEAITHLRGLKKGRRELQTKFKREANYWSRACREIAGRGHKVLLSLYERLNIHVIDPPLEDAAAEDTKVRRLDFVTTVRKGAAVFVVNLWEKEVQVDGEPYPALKDWNYDDFCAESNYLQKPAKDCSRHFGYLAQAYLAVRVNHPSNNWGDKVENCKLSFNKLYGLLKDPDVKADIMKVRGARGRDYAFKAESLAVELSG